MKIELENAVVYQGSNLDVLPTLPDNSVDSIVTDPPYELGFMGKSWDNSGIAYSVELWTECMRVLKPGGHLLAFGGSRTWHRLAVAIEDADFEMRDSIAWLYGSGFPKSMDVAKAIDKQSGYDGDVIGTETVDVGMQGGSMHAGRETKLAEREIKELSPEAKQWEGWGTALKPAFEPVVVARKPLEEKTVAANVLKYGTGGLNIDGSRIGTEERTFDSKGIKPGAGNYVGDDWQRDANPVTVQGRWPANIILDPYTAELLDEQSGISKPSIAKTGKVGGQQGLYENGHSPDYVGNWPSDNGGGASRFFYVAKASKKDRNEGLDHLEARRASGLGYDIGLGAPGEGMFKDRNPQKENFHPTVKPTALMEYLIKLVTPPNGTVLDPFTGSGSTGKAALLNGFKFIGIELTEEYLPIIEGRLKWASQQASKETNEVLF